MDAFENALPPEGGAKPIQNPLKTYEIDRRDRLLLGGTLVWCLLMVDTVLDSWPWGMGLTAGLFAWYALLLAVLGRRVFQRGESRALLAAGLVLAASFALTSDPWFRIWNFLALLALAPLQACGLTEEARLPWWRPAMLRERLWLLCGGLFGRLGAAFAALTPAGRRRDPRRATAAAVGLGAAVVLLWTLVPVLASADALFAAATAELRAFVRDHFTAALWKLMLALALSPFVFGLLHRLRRPAAPRAQKSAPALAADGLLFAIVLAALDGLYLLFLLVQSAGLFGGEAYLSQRGLSYAEWARSGFFQMVGVTVLNLTVTLAAVTFARRAGRSFAAVRGLATALAAESLVLLASAAWRMSLYVSAYGLSFKRLMTYWGMGMMAVFFLAALWKVWRPDRSFCRLAFAAALAGWLVINCVPVDYLVARDQVDRYLSGESATVSIHYLAYSLSYDTLSQLARLDGGRSLSAYEGDWWGPGKTLDGVLSKRRAAARAECADWRTWNLSACLAAGCG